jgi:hypothetical protein
VPTIADQVPTLADSCRLLPTLADSCRLLPTKCRLSADNCRPMQNLSNQELISYYKHVYEYILLFIFYIAVFGKMRGLL